MTSGNKRYRVAMHRWDVYVQWLEASSEAEAIERAEADYDENLDENWKHKDGNIDSFIIWDIIDTGGDQ
ncbi:MAG: hypothetical protein CTY31_14130 [Hyphomicrobium sp.]|nr:MAG: hypothetical protein CTY31_14130 [Hyphomicrobium sp.]